MPLTFVKISQLPTGTLTQDTLLIFELSSGLEIKATVGDLMTFVSLPQSVMTKDVYDPNGDGIVKDSDQLEGQNGAYYLDRANHTGTQAQTTITGLTAALAALIPLTQKAAVNGVATLDSNGLVPFNQLPFNTLNFLGVWDANTNTPTLSDASGTAKEMYIVSVAGTKDLGSGNITFAVADLVIHNGSIWQKVPTSTVVTLGVTDITTAVQTGATGSVTINNTAEINPSTDRNYVTDDEQGAISGANGPTALNVFVTMADLAGIGVSGSYPPSPNDAPIPARNADQTFASYGYTQPQIDAAYGAGFATTTDNVDWAAMQWMMQQACLNGTPLGLTGNYYMGDNYITMPLLFASNFFELHGFGNKIFFANDKGWTRVRPATLLESQQQQNMQFFVYDVKFYGGGAGVGFEPAANTNSIFHKLYIQDFATAATFRTTQNAMINSIDIHDCYNGVYVRTEELLVGQESATQSNGTRMYQPRYYNASDGGVGITYLGSYGGYVLGAQIEGNGSMDKAIYWDAQGLTTVKRFMVVDPHFESRDAFRTCAIDLSARDGVVDIVSAEHDIATTITGTGDNLLMVRAVSSTPATGLIVRVVSTNKWEPAVNGSYPGKWFHNTGCRWYIDTYGNEVPSASMFAGTMPMLTPKISDVGGDSYAYF